jgi:hypothetical protein
MYVSINEQLNRLVNAEIAALLCGVSLGRGYARTDVSISLNFEGDEGLPVHRFVYDNATGNPSKPPLPPPETRPSRENRAPYKVGRFGGAGYIPGWRLPCCPGSMFIPLQSVLKRSATISSAPSVLKRSPVAGHSIRLKPDDISRFRAMQD